MPPGRGRRRSSPIRGRHRPPANCRCSPRRGRTVPAPAAHKGRIRTGPVRTGRVRSGPDRPSRTGPAGRSGRAGWVRIRPGRPGPARTVLQHGRFPPPIPPGRTRQARTRRGLRPDVRVRTTPDQPLAAAAARRTVLGPIAAARTGPPMAGRARTDRRRSRTGRGRVASARPSGARRTGRRSATAARPERSPAPGRPPRRSSARRLADPGLPIRLTPGRSPGPVRPGRTTRQRARKPGPPGRAVGAAAGRRRRRAARLPSGRNRRRNRGNPRAGGRGEASESRSGEPAARSTSWSPPPSGGRGWPPAVGGDRWPALGRRAGRARAAASGGRRPRTASDPRASAMRGWPCLRRAVPVEAIPAGTRAAGHAPDGYAAGQEAYRPVAAGRWCGLGSRDRPGRRLRPDWGRAVDRPASSHPRRRLRRPSHARRGQTRRSDDSTGTSRPRACVRRAQRQACRPRLTVPRSPAIECRAGGRSGQGRRSIGLIRHIFISRGQPPWLKVFCARLTRYPEF
jgi:hypothetical protein